VIAYGPTPEPHCPLWFFAAETFGGKESVMYSAFIFINLFIAGLMILMLFDVRLGKGGLFARAYWRTKIGLSFLQAALLTVCIRLLFLS
jgi:hypothetical protein